MLKKWFISKSKHHHVVIKVTRLYLSICVCMIFSSLQIFIYFFFSPSLRFRIEISQSASQPVNCIATIFHLLFIANQPNIARKKRRFFFSSSLNRICCLLLLARSLASRRNDWKQIRFLLIKMLLSLIFFFVQLCFVLIEHLLTNKSIWYCTFYIGCNSFDIVVAAVLPRAPHKMLVYLLLNEILFVALLSLFLL